GVDGASRLPPKLCHTNEGVSIQVDDKLGELRSDSVDTTLLAVFDEPSRAHAETESKYGRLTDLPFQWRFVFIDRFTVNTCTEPPINIPTFAHDLERVGFFPSSSGNLHSEPERNTCLDLR